MSHARVTRLAALGFCALVGIFSKFVRADAFVTVNVAQVTNPDAPLLLGNAFDARASYFINGKNIGYYNSTDGAILPIGQFYLDHLQQTSLRYPMGPVNTWDWKATIGPQNLRPAQPLVNNQPAHFGLDEFFAMVESQPEASLQDVNMMVNIYRNVSAPDKAGAIQDAKDLVEYLNLPAGQGHVWADKRAANGHPQPYGIEIFNLGNEPWATTEYNFLTTGDPNPANDGAIKFAADAKLFIDAMKSVDPNVKITIPVASPRPPGPQQQKVVAWQQYMIDTLGHDAYAMLPNYYYDSLNPTQRGVGVTETRLNELNNQITTYNASHGEDLKVVIGEQAHAIQVDFTTNPPTPQNADFAMQWQGAVTTADFLMMLSSKSYVERAHFFIFGNALATWHPIRINDGTPPTYTIMPITYLYEELGNLVKDRALLTTTTSDLPGDDETYSVRAGTFISEDGMELSMVLVNRDPDLAHTIHLNGISGYSLTSAKLLWADDALSESIHIDLQSFLANQTAFTLDPLSVLLLEFEPVPEPAALLPLISSAIALIRRRTNRCPSRRSKHRGPIRR